jgi:hypothetical protein
VTVAAEAPRSINITLSPASSNQTVSVDADLVPSLQTADASIGSTISEHQIQRLPDTGGDVYERLRTSIGITGDGDRSGAGTAAFLPNGVGPGQSNSGIFQVENQVQISAARQGIGANDYTFCLDVGRAYSPSTGASPPPTPPTATPPRVAPAPRLTLSRPIILSPILPSTPSPSPAASASSTAPLSPTLLPAHFPSFPPTASASFAPSRTPILKPMAATAFATPSTCPPTTTTPTSSASTLVLASS